MELREGYKLTEVGVIPQDWSDVPCEDVVSIVDGDRGFNYPSKSELKPDGFCLFLNTGNVTKNGFKFKDCEFISKSKDENLRKGRLKRLDVVLTTRGTVGNFAHFNESVEFDNIRINSGMVILRQNNEGVSNSYLYAVLKSHILEAQIERLSFGSAQPQLTVKSISNFRIPIPTVKAEQRAIATALSDMDALLEGLDRLIAKKRDLKQATMQQLLTGKARLPGFEGEWEVKRLGEVAEIIMGQSPSSENYNTKGEGLPLIQGNADIEDRKTIKRVFTTQITKWGKAGDILMSVRAPVGEVSRAIFDVCLGRGVCAIRFPNDYLYHCLIFLEPTWAKHSKGSTFDSVNSNDIKEVEIDIPSDKDEQTAIATSLSDMDAEIEALQQRRAKTRNLKQAMMQELLTGRTRLVKPGEGANG